MNNQKLEQLAQFVIKEAKRLGATDSAVSISLSDSLSTDVRLGEIEKQEGAQEAGLNFTAFVGQKSVTCSSTDFRKSALTSLVRQTIAMAKETEADIFDGLIDKALLATNIPDLDLFDLSLSKISTDKKIQLAMAADKVAKQFDSRITSSDAGFYDVSTVVVYANSNGFIGSYKASYCALTASAIAKDDNGVMQNAYWSSDGHFFADLLSPESIGSTAAERALRYLGARKTETQVVPVVFENAMASRLLAQFCSALNGRSIYTNSSIMTGKLDQVVANEKIQIIDNPLIPRALGSFPFASEGLPAIRRNIVKDGVLQTYLLDGYAARKLGMKPNGAQTGNLYIEPGQLSVEEIIAPIKSGLLLTKVFGSGFKQVTGNYSVGAAGMWIENGEIAYPVHEITVAGNMLDMFKNIEAVGNDPYKSAKSSPTLKIASMTVAGK